MKKKCLAAVLVLLLVVTAMPLMGATAETNYYVVTSNQKGLNLRSDTSTDATVITVIPYGAKVGWIGLTENKSWAAVYYGDHNGYVMVRYLSKKKPAEPKKETPVTSSTYKTFEAADYYATVTPSTPTGYVNLRWAPSKSTEIHGRYHQGSTLRVIAENDSWAQVLDEATMTCGYMLKNFLR
ncbi:MAG: SH3 domain-containing protein [Eubacteriales bacterium]|nr:SH3 domain-containing protein [Eubacteriales bacterium]MDD3882919.1 SH3 domain-containing protein [Eubacteriales bacterium]MDD4513909.1 SH3 domain-containing protein [Eubacteriales bacterium]